VLRDVWDEHCNSGSKKETIGMSKGREDSLNYLLDFTSILQITNLITSIFGFTTF